MTRKKRIFLIISVLAFMAVAGVILGVVTAGNHNADSRNSSATPGEAQADTEGKEESDVLPAVPIQAENAGATEAVTEQSGEDVSVNGNGGTQDGQTASGVSNQDSQTKPAGSSGKQDSQTKPADSSGKQDGQNEQANPGTNGKKTDKTTTEKMTTESTTTTEQKTTEQTTETPDDSGVVELPFVPAD